MYSLLFSLAPECPSVDTQVPRPANTVAVLKQPVRDETVFKLVLLSFLITAQSSPSPTAGGGVQKGVAAPALDPSGPVAPPF